MTQSLGPRVIVLTGPMGAGKSAVGALLADQYGGVIVDSDEEIETRAQKSIAELFATEGESAFRALERNVCVSCMEYAPRGTVLALGGGAFMNEDIRRAATGSDILSVYLHTSPEVSWSRIQNTPGGAEQRPLLAHPNPLARLQELYDKRHPVYAQATLTVDTDALKTDDVAQAILRFIECTPTLNAAQTDACTPAVSTTSPSSPMIEVRTRSARYPVTFVDQAEEVAQSIQGVAPSGRLLILSDENVAPLYLDPLTHALQAHDRTVRTFVVPAGETSKSVGRAAALWDQIFAGDVDRQDTIVALGGGVVGDLAGFIASTTMRGLDFIQIPTTMLAMADAAIGGKTGINVAAGKNLVGAFHQPLAVIAWIGALSTLPHRQLTSGLAEVIKSAMIDSPEAVAQFRTIAARAVEGDTDAVRECARIGAGLKARIVSEDEKERGVRSLLNYGHTFAHAIEHARGYGEWTHGEAVAAGMVIATQYAHDHGLASEELVQTIRMLVRSVGLPEDPPKMTLDEWIEPIFRDKKRSGDSVKLILPRSEGDLIGQETHFDTLSRWMADHIAVS